MFWLVIGIANLIIGMFIGLTGIAGFLLPMLYAGTLHMGVTEALALSFAAFLISGILGAYNYHKAGNMDLTFALKLSLGSLIGALAGVRLNLLIPEEAVKLLLYTVVLLSGISILLRKEGDLREKSRCGFQIKEHLAVTLLFGAVTGAICSLSGAGGPVLVMPLLVVLGIPIRTAVGVALFDSVFIAVPACTGYLSQCSIRDLLPVLAVSLICHGVGVFSGSLWAARVNQKLLKRGIAVFSILIAAYKLLDIYI